MNPVTLEDQIFTAVLGLNHLNYQLENSKDINGYIKMMIGLLKWLNSKDHGFKNKQKHKEAIKQHSDLLFKAKEAHKNNTISYAMKEEIKGDKKRIDLKRQEIISLFNSLIKSYKKDIRSVGNLYISGKKGWAKLNKIEKDIAKAKKYKELIKNNLNILNYLIK